MLDPITRPILFSSPMVLALLARTKSMARRIVKPQPPVGAEPFEYQTFARGNPDHFRDGWYDRFGNYYGNRWQVGMRLWAREALTLPEEDDPTYKADGSPLVRPDGIRWGHVIGTVPSIHMPRWASRITLELTAVRVERVQEISISDATAEGCKGVLVTQEWVDDCKPGSKERELAELLCGGSMTAKWAYQQLWDTINGPGSWSANPFVFVLSFRKVNPCLT